MSLKIGIITLSSSNNCGSCLQSYALKKILESYGDVEVINFSSIKSHRLYDIFSMRVFRSGLRHPIQLLHRFTHFTNLMREKKAYEDFRKNYINIHGREFFAGDLTEIASKYDVIVAGSDQVWNVCMYDFDEAFFVPWAKCKKIAYAPSLGGYDIRESNNYEKIKEYIADFSMLSVREEPGKKCLEEITGRPVKKVLDPTLMLPLEEWQKMIGDPIISGDYIFFYSWAYCYEELLDIVAKESQKSNLPVYVIDSRKWINIDPEKYGFHLSSNEGPLAFLNLMYYAKRCYVESFHGMLFAYMFKKDFWLLDTSKSFNELDTRLKELVLLIDAKERILTKFNKNEIDQSVPVRYEPNPLLEKMRKESSIYLSEAFK